MMLAMLHDLVRHKGYANAKLMRAIRQHEAASEDYELRRLFHHILLANRFWLMLSLGRAFSFEAEAKVPESWEILTAQYQETHKREQEWLNQLIEADLARTVETHFIPGKRFSLSEALMQVCMHSHGHRAQCATRLRLLGGVPPNLDFILWLKDRPAADWPSYTAVSRT
jgi:uncharacterized damage-inducible protein DinB